MNTERIDHDHRLSKAMTSTLVDFVEQAVGGEQALQRCIDSCRANAQSPAEQEIGEQCAAANEEILSLYRWCKENWDVIQSNDGPWYSKSPETGEVSFDDSAEERWQQTLQDVLLRIVKVRRAMWT